MIHPTGFTIALPVYNGGELLKKCVDSVLNQTYSGFVLEVFNSFDNCDGSTEYLNSLTDTRVKIIQASKKLTIEENWSRFKDGLKTEYATIIGQDDLLHPDFLEEMRKKILDYPDASLWHSHYSIINVAGEVIRTCKPLPFKESVSDYLTSILTISAETIGTGYVFRSADYKKMGGIPLFTNLLFADFALWLKLTSFSYKVNLPEVLFSFRIHESTTSRATPEKYFTAFKSFVQFLLKEANENETIKESLRMNMYVFLRFYAEVISLRVIKSPEFTLHATRVTVQEVLHFCLETSKLVGNATFPGFTSKTKVAALIDKIALLRGGFKLFRKVYSKPILK